MKIENKINKNNKNLIKTKFKMKKIIATISCMALLTFGFTNLSMAQDAVATEQTEQVTEAPATEETVATTEAAPATEETAPMQEESENISMHQNLKTKFIEGGANFMALVAIALILGLAICLERIIYLNLADTNAEKFLNELESTLKSSGVEKAKELARNTRGPIASIAYQALLRADHSVDVIEKSVVSYGGVQGGLLEKNLSWITLFIAMAPSLGFLGTVIGMVQAFDNIEKVGDISPTVVAGGMKIALITTIGGLVVALILQVFYNYILSKVEGILNRMEDASISILDMIIAHKEK